MTNHNLDHIKVLLVDDDAVSNYIVSRKLKKLGIKNIDLAENGADALEYLKNNLPDLIFLDINMPIIDGHEFMLEYNNRNFSGDINIFILSSSDRACDREKFLGFNNVVDYMQKPLENPNIIKAIDSLESVIII